jgi:hypothetical protein
MMRDVYSPLPHACRFNSCKICGEGDVDYRHCLQRANFHGYEFLRAYGGAFGVSGCQVRAT